MPRDANSSGCRSPATEHRFGGPGNDPTKTPSFPGADASDPIKSYRNLKNECGQVSSKENCQQSIGHSIGFQGTLTTLAIAPEFKGFQIMQEKKLHGISYIFLCLLLSKKHFEIKPKKKICCNQSQSTFQSRFSIFVLFHINFGVGLTFACTT